MTLRRITTTSNGKKAGYVLERSLFEITPDEIAEVNVLATMMYGRIAHEEAADWIVPNPADKFEGYILEGDK